MFSTPPYASLKKEGIETSLNFLSVGILFNLFLRWQLERLPEEGSERRYRNFFKIFVRRHQPYDGRALWNHVRLSAGTPASTTAAAIFFYPFLSDILGCTF